MRATIYYLSLTNAQTNILNGPENEGGGWSGEIGRAYLDAKYKGDYVRAVELDMMELAAFTAIRGDADLDPHSDTPNEIVWRRLQNINEPWSTRERDTTTCVTSFPRSMDVGDLIIWHEHGDHPETVMRVQGIGFAPANVSNLPAGRMPPAHAYDEDVQFD